MNDRPYAVPRATYRLQLGRHLTFDGVAALAGYLADLGISHAYLSPVHRVRRGSTHGYDVVEHGELNPELGTLEDFRAMARELRRHGISILLDIVPNHMAVGDDNRYWLDVLEHGRHSRYAEWFDIDWSPPDPVLAGKVLVPMLGEPYEQALRSGALRLAFDAATETFAVWAHDTHKLPLDPATYGAVLAHAPGADPESAVAAINADPAALDAIIGLQHWRIAHHSAARQINYRRFFTVNDLAGIRVEREDVFDHVHRLVFALVEEGLVEGLRIDHVDGLFDPERYCRELRRRCPRPVYVAVEKILAPREWLKEDWQVDGATGYEFGARITNLLADPAGEAALTAAYYAATGHEEPIAEIIHRARLEVLDNDFAAELGSLVSRLHALVPAARRDDLRAALRQVVVRLDVYRTYVGEAGADGADRLSLGAAIAAARRAEPAIPPDVFAAIESVLCRPAPGEALLVARRFQQLTGPVMAKGLEDRALYRANRLIGLNDVGARPDRFAASVASFHDFNRERLRRHPHAMLAGSTHDSKRGEDARARIVALSGFATEWAGHVAEWRDLLRTAGAPEIDPNDAWYVFQQLLGAWPMELGPERALDASTLAALRDRLEAAMIKAVREAAVHTSWVKPDADYEAAVRALIEVALSAERENAFLASFRAFEERIGWAGARNALVAVALKLTAPGVPDVYQGAELWEQSMVDPDNRRPVDFPARRSLLAGLGGTSVADLAASWRDGRVKLALTATLLRLRRREPHLFSEGSYEPVAVTGPHRDRVCAFIRRRGQRAVLVAVRLWPGRSDSIDAGLALEAGAWFDLLERRQIAGPQPLTAAKLFARLPVAVLARGVESREYTDMDLT